MEIADRREQIDLSRIGPTLVIASSLILAIRTAKWSRVSTETASQIDWEAEIEQAIRMAHDVLSHLMTKSPYLFQQKGVMWHQPGDQESPR